MDFLTLISSDTNLKRVATTNGGEYAGPCPKCGGRDRFRVWPEQSRFWCRGCEWGGDAIQYLRDQRGLSFAEAKAQASGDMFSTVPGKARNTLAPERHSVQPPAADWQAQARQVVTSCSAALWSDAGARAREWLRERGLTDDTLRAWHIGYSPDGPDTFTDDKGVRRRKIAGLAVPCGIVIPCEAAGEIWYINVRRATAAGDQNKYVKVKGSRSALFGVDHSRGLPDVFVVEGEFDAMLLHQEAGDVADVLTLGSAGGRPADEQLIYLLGAHRFHVATDADDAGEKAAAHWFELVGKRGHRLTSPGNHKDVTDAWKAGADLRAWALEVQGVPQAAPVVPAAPSVISLPDLWSAAYDAWVLDPKNVQLGLRVYALAEAGHFHAEQPWGELADELRADLKEPEATGDAQVNWDYIMADAPGGGTEIL